MAYQSDRTGASIDAVLDNADNGNIGKEAPVLFAGDADTLIDAGFYGIYSTTANIPLALNSTIIVTSRSAGYTTQTFITTTTSPRIFTRARAGGAFGAWKELYHTGNTGNTEWNDASLPAGTKAVYLPSGGSKISWGTSVGTAVTAISFNNTNGQIGQISVNGTSTSYQTSSDPRLKDFKPAPTDTEIDTKFNLLFDSFEVFNWKNDPDGDLVWGFNAHKAIDNGLDMGSEGDGSRDLELGAVYDTTPAEVDKDGNETKAAIDHIVTPAGVDQSKAVPILLAKIEQLERRLKMLEG